MKILRILLVLAVLAYAGWLAWPFLSPFLEGAGMDTAATRAGAEAQVGMDLPVIALWVGAVVLYLVAAGLLGSGNPRAAVAYFLGFLADAVLRLAIDRGGFGSGSEMGGKVDPNSPMAQSTITEGGPAAAPGGLGADLGVDPTWLVLGALVLLGILIVVVSRTRRRKRVPGQLSV
ncbi:hypothetical protein [Brevundimonas sp. A19_0]|uniref:hypothetical protein n=1 Tax=Brevundimonas sp. A19_0 TaxID=2821087 RepID=UPI001ADC53D6|nr:hypothetical protein [Brevundimonas sp. A19_0]MBO9501478.1 hypothetical protein [Brevundimonas sp. A19_0]